MLDLIRRKQKTFLVKLIFWVIIATFVGTIFFVWGKGEDRSGDPAATAMVINSEKVPLDAFHRAYNNLYALYQSLYREQFSVELERQLGLRQMVLERVVDQTLLAQEAQRRRLSVSRDELVASIAEIPAFQQGGVFNRDLYLQVLGFQRISPEEFEASQRRQLLVNKVIDLLQAHVEVNEDDITEEHRRRGEAVNLEVAVFAPALFETEVAVSDESLAAWFAENREQLRIPTRVALRYLEFEPARYRDKVNYTQEDLERYYRRNMERFETTEQVRAAHILFRVSEDSDAAQLERKEQLARKVLEEARAGKDFAELARRHSDDQASAVQGGDLGHFGRGVMTPAFEAAAFALQPGELSDLVRTPFGFHIIKVTATQQQGLKPLEDVIDEVREGVRQQLARQRAIDAAMDAYNHTRLGRTLEEVAAENDLGIKETGLFSRQEAIDGIGLVPEINQSAFVLEPGQVGRPVVLPQGIFLISIKERQESHLPELEEVRTRAEAAYRRYHSHELARSRAEQVRESLQQGATVAQLARQQGFRSEETGFFSRSFEGFIPRVGVDAELAAAAFTLRERGAVAPEVYEVDGKYVVASLKERREADMAALDAATRASLREILLVRKQEEALERALQALRESAKIEITPALTVFLER